MLSALAPSGPVAPAVPTSPPSIPDTTQPAPRESFQDVYRDVPRDDDSNDSSGPKQKAGGSTDAKLKKSGTDGGNDKTAVTAAPFPHGLVFQKAPLVLAFPAPGQEEAPGSDGSASTLEDGSQSPKQSGVDASAQGVVPDFGAPIVKPGHSVATALVPANEKLAFSARLTQPDTSSRPGPAPRISVPAPGRFQTSDETRTNAGPASAASGKDAYQTVDIKKTASPTETVLPAREISSASALDLRQNATAAQSAEAVHGTTGRSLAIQDIQPNLPEIPKPPASTEILLQLAGKDQSTASVRVVDRSGTVNVTVHAADPELRSSLRSNLGDLASQLTGQGFKTEVVKPAVIAANAENQHDSRHGGQDSPGQQQHQSAQDNRQPQRDRRANPERWLDELKQETSGIPGGKS